MLNGSNAAMPAVHQKSDVEIKQRIEEMLNRTPKMREERISVSVVGGVATFTGSVKRPGAKGGVYAIAHSSGAASVINRIVQAPQ